MDIQTIISTIESWFSLVLIWRIFLGVCIVVFIIMVPKALKDIAHYLRQIYLYGAGACPDYDDDDDDDDDDVNPKIDVNSQFWHKN